MKLSTILIAVVACTSLLFAQEAAAPKAEKPAKKEATSTISGTVVSVDAIANTIIVKVKKGEDTLAVEAGAKIKSGKKDVTLGEIAADSKVTVTCKKVDGKNVATTIVAKAAAAPKAAPAAK